MNIIDHARRSRIHRKIGFEKVVESETRRILFWQQSFLSFCSTHTGIVKARHSRIAFVHLFGVIFFVIDHHI